MTDDHQRLREAIKCARMGGRSVSTFTNRWSSVQSDALEMLIAAAESTLPKTKMVEVWHVEYTHYGKPSLVIAMDAVEAQTTALQIHKDNCQCIRVTGPHQQEVPA